MIRNKNATRKMKREAKPSLSKMKILLMATLLTLFFSSCASEDKKKEIVKVESPISVEHLKPTIIAEDGSEMLLIPAGEFIMGSPEGKGEEYERPQHTVYLDAFYIDKYEITNAQYYKFIAATGHRQPPWVETKDPQYPIVGVSWNDADTYARWNNKRLPTEAQWEKAARGTDQREYPWGNENPNAHIFGGIWRANFHPDLGKAGDDGYERLAPVGSFPEGASPYGVMDMAGNVWEWVYDWFDPNYYKRSPKENPAGPNEFELSKLIGSGEKMRVIRGGSWGNGDRGLKVTMRGKATPNTTNGEIGFRCIKYPGM